MNIKVTIGNSSSKVEGLSAKQIKELTEILSYTPNANRTKFSGKQYGRKTRLLTPRGHRFPTGLLYLVQAYLKGYSGVIYADTRIKPQSRPGLFTAQLPYAPYPEQEQAALAAVKRCRGIIAAPTALGKSLICALIIRNLQVFTLIVVPSLELKRQLTETLTTIFGSDRVGGLGLPIAVENVAALDPKRVPKGYDCVIIDEFHHSGAKTYRQLNKLSWGGIYYRFGLTATPFRSDENEKILLESVLSQVIYRIEYKTAVEKGYVVPLEAYYYDLPKTSLGTATTWPQVYRTLFTTNAALNTLVSDLVLSLDASGVSSLVLVKEVEHGRRLEGSTGMPFANGKDGCNKALIQDFNSKASNSLIGTVGIVGEGVDTKPAEYVLLAGGGKSKNAFMQQCGRVLRIYAGKTSGKVILFRDSSHKWTLKHFRACCKFLKEEYGIIPVKL